ncbi:Hypothetical_protein [Hexamita inflata]|uniref:Hypothetical_protein n=1 Tax=Hexamita inflata TaxID=28002 RepID=A0ABP1H8C4_9EUKA
MLKTQKKQTINKQLTVINEEQSVEQIITSNKNPQNGLERIDSQSCDLFWDQSSKTNVLMTKIKMVNGKKNYKRISIETRNVSKQSTSNNSFFDIFKDDVFK